MLLPTVVSSSVRRFHYFAVQSSERDWTFARKHPRKTARTPFDWVFGHSLVTVWAGEVFDPRARSTRLAKNHESNTSIQKATFANSTITSPICQTTRFSSHDRLSGPCVQNSTYATIYLGKIRKMTPYPLTGFDP